MACRIDQFDVSVANSPDDYGRDQRNPSMFTKELDSGDDGVESTLDKGIDAISGEESNGAQVVSTFLLTKRGGMECHH